MTPEKLPDASTATTIALISGTLGAFLAKVVSVMIRRKFSEADSIRRELRERAARIEEEFKALHVELDEWKGKYYNLVGQHVELKAEYKIIKAEIELLKASAPRSGPGVA